MKTSLKKLQKFAAIRHDKRGAKQHQSLNQDELARATQDMSDMRDCYDTLLSAAAATANSAYEFSESLKEMGGCLLEKTSLNDDEESGKVLLMLGKTQFELQKLVDVYRSHIFQTITIPSESLLNELHIVEDMKKRCDEKREIYEALSNKPKEKGRSKGNKGDHVPSHQLKAAHDDFDEEANVFVFRMMSLKQGQSRSLLTQAARHHAAQLCFFKKALRYLEAIDPNVRFVAEQQHIDFQFIGHKDKGLDTYEDDDDESYSTEDYDSSDVSETLDDEGLKIDDAQDPSTAKHSMELDDADITVSPDTKSGAGKELLRIPGRSSFSFRRGSVSAPLFPEKKYDSPSHKFTSYVLPMPNETKGPVSDKTDNIVPQTRPAALNICHSYPTEKNKFEKFGSMSGPTLILDTQSVLKETDSAKASRLPPPLSELKQFDPSIASYAKKPKRQSFSGPITEKQSTDIPSSGSVGYPPHLLRTLLPRPMPTPKLSARASPTFMSSPKISELHELPLPPDNPTPRRPNRNTHSGPLVSTKNELAMPTATSANPLSPQSLPRSYSIPAGGPVDVDIYVSLQDPLPDSQKS